MNKPMRSFLSVHTRRQFCKSALVASSVVLGASVTSRFAYASNGTLVPLYRLYNPQNLDHLYTLQSNEGTSLGYIYEGIACHIYSLTSQPIPNVVGLFRMYSNDGGHFYTASVAEEQSLEENEVFLFEAIIGGVYPPTIPQPAGTIPLFRLFHYDNNRHFYTTNPTERIQALEQGFSDEGVACYVFP